MATDNNQNVTSGVRPGLRLRKARESQHLSIDDVARHLKSSKKIIEALEKEDVDELPQAIYVSGYLKSYAGLVSLPIEDILATYPKKGEIDPVIPTFSGTVNNSRFSKAEGGGAALAQGDSKVASILIVIIIVIIIGAGGWYYIQNNDSASIKGGASSQKNTSTKGAAASQTTSISDSTDTSMGEQNSSTDLHTDMQKAIVEELLQEELQKELQQENLEDTLSTKLSVNKDATTSTSVTTPMTTKVKSEPDVPANTSRLLLELAKDSWVEVEDASGEKLLYRLVKAPARRVVDGLAPFKVFLGNAPGVKINYNGRPYDLKPHIDGDIAQFNIGVSADNKSRKKN